MEIKDVLRLVLYAAMTTLGVCNIICAVKRKNNADAKNSRLEGWEIAASILMIISGAILLLLLVIPK